MVRVIEELKEIRDRCDISNADLADTSGISASNISRIFTGKLDNPTILTLVDIAQALGTDIGVIEQSVGETVTETRISNAEIFLYKRIIKDRDKVIDEKNMWIKRLFLILGCVVAFIITFLIFDLFNGGFGYIRY